jgi:hypothetical protein
MLLILKVQYETGQGPVSRESQNGPLGLNLYIYQFPGFRAENHPVYLRRQSTKEQTVVD